MSPTPDPSQMASVTIRAMDPLTPGKAPEPYQHRPETWTNLKLLLHQLEEEGLSDAQASPAPTVGRDR